MSYAMRTTLRHGPRTVVRISDKGKSSYLQRPLQRLFPLEILDDVKKELESFTEDVTSVLKEGKPESV